MTDSHLSFIDVNEGHSQLIYKRFHSGCVVNRKEFNRANSEWHYCQLYKELVDHPKHYQLLYRHLGYELCHDEDGQFYSVKSLAEMESEDEIFDETSLKVIAIISLIARVVIHRGQALMSLGEPVQGITYDDLESLFAHSTNEAILKTFKFKTAKEPMDFLIKRGFAYVVSNNRYVLSRGGLSMLETLIEREKEQQVVL